MEGTKTADTAIRTVCFTGHREITHDAAIRLPVALESTVEGLYKRGATVFRAGGAIGFDTIAALKVLEMRERYPLLRLELILPCRNQTERWDDHSIRTYQYILERADVCRFLFDTYVEGCMHERDRRLVEGCDACIAYCARSQGGTAFTLMKAFREGLEVINLYDELRQE